VKRPTNQSHTHQEKKPISQHAMRYLLPDSLLSSPVVSVGINDPVAEATNLLSHNLETFTDSLVVVQDDKPVGLVGGADVLEGLLLNPNAVFFEKTKIKEIMNKNLIIVDKDATLGELLNQWLKTNRAFAIIPNQYSSYSAISARKLLEIGMSCKTKLEIKDISKKKIFTFRRNQTVNEAISTMFKNRTRKLILEGTSQFISDRIIIQKISQDLNCLHGVDDFLEMKCSEFRLDKAKEASGKILLEEASKMLYEMQSPYLLYGEGVLTPWDIIQSLGLESLTEYVLNHKR
jgi:predicted transcriptional regulator